MSTRQKKKKNAGIPETDQNSEVSVENFNNIVDALLQVPPENIKKPFKRKKKKRAKSKEG